MSSNTSLNRSINILENIALSKDISTSGNLKSVVAVVIPVVVDSVKKSVTSNLWCTTGGSVDVVTLKSNQIRRASEVHVPVMVSITSSRPGGNTVDVVVGDGNTTRSGVSEDDVLTTDERGGYAINPDHVRAIDSNSIASPHVLGVDVGDLNVLDDDVGDAGDHAETLSEDDTGLALADEGLVGLNGDSERSSIVTVKWVSN